MIRLPRLALTFRMWGRAACLTPSPERLHAGRASLFYARRVCQDSDITGDNIIAGHAIRACVAGIHVLDSRPCH